MARGGASEAVFAAGPGMLARGGAAVGSGAPPVFVAVVCTEPKDRVGALGPAPDAVAADAVLGARATFGDVGCVTGLIGVVGCCTTGVLLL